MHTCVYYYRSYYYYYSLGYKQREGVKKWCTKCGNRLTPLSVSVFDFHCMPKRRQRADNTKPSRPASLVKPVNHNQRQTPRHKENCQREQQQHARGGLSFD